MGRRHKDWETGGYPGANEEISTCFALLFLCRANIAKDLTANLKGRVKDPGVSVLRGGAVPGIADRKPPNPVEPANDPMVKVARRLSRRPNPRLPRTRLPPSRRETISKKRRPVWSIALINAAPAARPALLVQLRDSKGSVHTEALAQAAADRRRPAAGSQGPSARRLTRMTAATLREMMKDDNREIRHGAAAACGLKDDRQYVPDLINALGGADAEVVRAAPSSLKSLSGKDFGPEIDASPETKKKAAAEWKTWWSTQAK